MLTQIATIAGFTVIATGVAVKIMHTVVNHHYTVTAATWIKESIGPTLRK